MDRFFHPQNFQKQETLLFDGEEIHHMKVLRIREGESIEIINGKNELAIGNVLKVGRRKIEVQIEKIEKREKSAKEWVLVVGLSPLHRLENIVEKTTELGIDQIIFFQAELTQKMEPTPSQKTRLEKIAISAIKQCKRWDLPTLKYAQSLSEVLSLCKKQYFGDFDAPSISSLSPSSSIAFYIGPEKGFSEKERKLLKENCEGVCLSENVLRVDTACISAVSHFSSRALPSRDKQDHVGDQE